LPAHGDLKALPLFKDILDDFIAPLWQYAGLFEPVVLAGDGADKFKLSSYAAQAGVARQEFLRPGENLAYIEGVQFENTSAIDYHIGLRPTYIVSELVVNPKDGTPQWTLIKHMIGLEDNPDSVVDNLDDTLTMVVDSITEAGVSNAGRKVQVFQFTPSEGATSYAIATQICTVAWDGSNNKITTVDAGSGEGYLGQTTPSTTAGDYTVVLLGPHVSRNTDLSLDQDYAYLGTVKGAGAGNPPTVFDTSGQIIFGSSTISNLWQITRLETGVSPSRLKIDVKAVAAEEGSAIDQIRVSGWDGVGGAKTVFKVDELGNVVIEGDLDVKGETTQEDLVTINASEIVTDSLTLGDHDTADSHLIKGTWWHRDSGETVTWFVVDGSSGNVGIGTTAHATYDLNVGAGGAQFAGDIFGASKNIGSIGTPWARFYGSGITVTSDAIAGEFYANRSNGPRISFDRTDASDPNHQQHFRIGSESDGTLNFRSYDKDWSGYSEFLLVTKNATSEVVDLVTIAAPTEATSNLQVKGDPTTGSPYPGRLDYYNTDSGITDANAKRWGVYPKKTGTSSMLTWQTVNDDGSTPSDMMRLTRTGLLVVQDIDPMTGATSIGAGTEFLDAYFSDVVHAEYFEADGDPAAGAANTVRYTNTTSGINDVANGTIRLAVAANNTGWLKIWDGTTARYVPFFDAT